MLHLWLERYVAFVAGAVQVKSSHIFVLFIVVCVQLRAVRHSQRTLALGSHPRYPRDDETDKRLYASAWGTISESFLFCSIPSW